MRTYEELVEQLPPDVRQEVRDFIESLLEKRRKKLKGRPSFEWAGALRDLQDRYTSVQLQHQIAEWRTSGQ